MSSAMVASALFFSRTRPASRSRSSGMNHGPPPHIADAITRAAAVRNIMVPCPVRMRLLATMR